MNFGKCEFTMVNNTVLLDGHREQFWDRLHGSTLKMNATFLTKASWRSQHSELWNHSMCSLELQNLVPMQATYYRSENYQLSAMPCFALWLHQCLRQQGTSVKPNGRSQQEGQATSSWATRGSSWVQGVASLSSFNSETCCSTHDCNVTPGM